MVFSPSGFGECWTRTACRTRSVESGQGVDDLDQQPDRWRRAEVEIVAPDLLGLVVGEELAVSYAAGFREAGANSIFGWHGPEDADLDVGPGIGIASRRRPTQQDRLDARLGGVGPQQWLDGVSTPA